jgi:1-acyl-sn-glycerol-3-phosphate acyltransferase
MVEAANTPCIALTKTGTPCKNTALEGSNYCWVHQSYTPGEQVIEQDRVEASIPVEDLAAVIDTNSQEKLATELDEMISQVKEIAPDYTPPPFSPKGLMKLLQENIDRFSPPVRLQILERLRSGIGEDMFDIDTWKGIWYMLNYTVEYQSDFLKRRLTGDYETDEWGLDMEFIDTIRPFLEFMHQNYWRVETTGIENVPSEGSALLVANHSGQLPWDAAMLGVSVYNEHPAQRLVRTLYADWFPTLPFVSAFLTKMGQVLATEDNGARLLEQGEIVSVFPEGIKGVGKLYRDRYRLARFGRGGFVRMALRNQAPVIPVSIVGAEEIYISLAKSNTIAKMIGFPFFPISVTWPWLGPLGFVPFPTKWYIDIGEPIPMESYKSDDANNLMLVSQLTDQIRNIIQQMVFGRLAQRRSVLFG